MQQNEDLQFKAYALDNLIIRINESIAILENIVTEDEVKTNAKNYPYLYGATRQTLAVIQDLANRIKNQIDNSNGSPNANSIDPNELPFIDPESLALED
ncbi:hypothetical protein F4V57_07490 [Acinetobacter qingfengensis]|uniref:Uncharacterized protein n=1 Tax=Acinetobacter qingfengensis TaxID=1262585 RepID=A0A1E7R2Q9_9GAMM|nr:hypothetical protein [Acinetobacter qingfengensis]KAA8733884.1 hypothetical protein F4V57_07490 [Acinetobacter qingfengensis]OEY93604.1 hypothetical protein BJI46_03945 [Acinetobacter qingfengensis]